MSSTSSSTRRPSWRSWGVALLLAPSAAACIDVTPTPPLEGGLPAASGDAGNDDAALSDGGAATESGAARDASAGDAQGDE